MRLQCDHSLDKCQMRQWGGWEINRWKANETLEDISGRQVYSVSNSGHSDCICTAPSCCHGAWTRGMCAWFACDTRWVQTFFVSLGVFGFICTWMLVCLPTTSPYKRSYCQYVLQYLSLALCESAAELHKTQWWCNYFSCFLLPQLSTVNLLPDFYSLIQYEHIDGKPNVPTKSI